jgi:hypothetical protein
VNYARRQHYRRIWHAGEAALLATVVAALGLGAASIGARPLAAVLLFGAVGPRRVRIPLVLLGGP